MPVSVQTGISDGRLTEVSGDRLEPGLAVITDQRSAGGGIGQVGLVPAQGLNLRLSFAAQDLCRDLAGLAEHQDFHATPSRVCA